MRPKHQYALLMSISVLLSCGSRTGIFDKYGTSNSKEKPENALSVSCKPTKLETSIGQQIILRGDIDNEEGHVNWMWQLIERPQDSASMPLSPFSQETPIFIDKMGNYVFQLHVGDVSGQQDFCETTITAHRSRPNPICPDDITTTPLREITLKGDGFDDGKIVSWNWSLIEKPDASSALQPSPEESQNANFTPDVAGMYVTELRIIDDEGIEGSCQTQVIAIPDEGLRVELYWNPPDRSCSDWPQPCDSTDLDIHLLHPTADKWFASGDCYFGNCIWENLEWDILGPHDNPHLDLDDTDGFGPENVNINEPVIGHAYTIGVHFYSEDHTALEAAAYVKIFCGIYTIEPAYVVGPVSLRAYENSDNNDFWRVATVEWNGNRCLVTPLVAPDGGFDIIPTYEAQSSR